MRLNAYVDVLIPRGSAGLIRTVKENSTIPVIETGTGNCQMCIRDRWYTGDQEKSPSVDAADHKICRSSAE